MPDVRADDRLATAVDLALGELQEIGEREVALAPLTTYRVGGPAAVFARPVELGDFARVAAARRVSGLPVTVIGRGSNLLVADRGYPGIVVSVAGFADHVEFDDDAATVTAGSAVTLPVLARRTASRGLTGFEWAVGVPGSIGGAARMNAGGHGSDMAACIVGGTLVHLDSASPATPRTVDAVDFGLRFRGSDIGATDVVFDVVLQLAHGERASSEREIDDIVAWRRANQPGGQNAGSVFVNPVPGEVSAGALIDAAGLRGLRLGTAEVSTKHANFIQAAPGGSADDVHALMRLVRDRVHESSGHLLRSEIRLLGFEELV